MAYTPISGIVPQISKNAGGAAASGYYLKGYAAGTTTPLSMGTDATPTATLVKCKLNSIGNPISNDADETTTFIPYFNASYKLVLYVNSTDADANTTANAVWVVDNISGPFDASNIIYRSTQSVASYLDNKTITNYTDLIAAHAATPYVDNDGVTLTDFGISDEGVVVEDAAHGITSTEGMKVALDADNYWRRNFHLDASVFWWLSAAQIADVQAYTYGVDVTTAVQTAMDATHAININLHAPAGGYRVTGIVQPGQSIAPNDDRTRSWRFYGQGTGEALALGTPVGSTIFDSVTDAPVFQDQLSLATASNGTSFIEQMRFHGTTTADPIVKFQSLFGICQVRNIVVYQRGAGDGVSVGRGSLYEFFMCWAFNSDWLGSTLGLGASRTGKAWRIATTSDAALITLNKCSGRGFKDAQWLEGAGGKLIGTKIIDCQASVVYNGLTIIGESGTVVDNYYAEAGDGGKGIDDQGVYTDVRGGIIGSGFTTCLDASDTVTGKGNTYDSVTLSLGATTNSVALSIASSAAFGGYNKSATNISITRTQGTADQTGVLIAGTDPRLTISNISFDPKTAWTGTNSVKIDDQSTSGIYGLTQGISGNYEFPVLSKGGISLFDSTTLTESDVATNVMTLGDGISYFEVTATVATVVTSFDAGNTGARLIMLRTTNTNLTINDGGRVILDGSVAFTGAGMITFIMRNIGGLTYAYEQSRVAH